MATVARPVAASDCSRSRSSSGSLRTVVWRTTSAISAVGVLKEVAGVVDAVPGRVRDQRVPPAPSPVKMSSAIPQMKSTGRLVGVHRLEVGSLRVAVPAGMVVERDAQRELTRSGHAFLAETDEWSVVGTTNRRPPPVRAPASHPGGTETAPPGVAPAGSPTTINVPQLKRSGTLSRKRPPGSVHRDPVADRRRVLVAVVVKPGVHDHEPREPLGHADDLRETGRSAPVLREQRDVAEVERLDQSLRFAVWRAMSYQAGSRDLVASPEPDVIGRDAAEPGVSHRRDDVPVEVAPRRHPVDHERDGRIPGSLVDVVHPEPVDVEVVGIERKVGESCEVVVRCPHKGHVARCHDTR